MKCIRCGGTVFKDNSEDSDNIREFYCIQCGRRWFLPWNSKVARWMEKR